MDKHLEAHIRLSQRMNNIAIAIAIGVLSALVFWCAVAYATFLHTT